MKGALSFKAQALDNTSPDFYQHGDDLLIPEEQVARQKITNAISDVSLSGNHHLKDDGAELIVFGRRFMAQVSCQERDTVGRRASIICCGEFTDDEDPAYQTETIIGAIHAFATRIGRTVEPFHLEAVRNELAVLKKKRSMRTPIVLLGLIVSLIILIAALIY